MSCSHRTDVRFHPQQNTVRLHYRVTGFSPGAILLTATFQDIQIFHDLPNKASAGKMYHGSLSPGRDGPDLKMPPENNLLPVGGDWNMTGL